VDGGLITPREWEVLLATARTGTTRAAAEELGIAESTVKNHLASAKAAVAKHVGHPIRSTLQMFWVLLGPIEITIRTERKKDA
jgi:FixJ family two-component response regulator